MTFHKSFFVAFILSSCVAVAQAQTPTASDGSGGIVSKLEVNKVVVKDNKETLEPAGTARPGDVLQYVALYTNKGRTGVSNLEATLPIPANTEIIMESIKPVGAKASTGGSTFGDIPLKRKVRQANGAEVEQMIPAREYRSLRWYPGVLAAGATVGFTVRVKVLDDRQPPQKQ